MSYLGAWGIVATLAIFSALIFGRKSGYGLIVAVILFAVLAGSERFKEVVP